MAPIFVITSSNMSKFLGFFLSEVLGIQMITERVLKDFFNSVFSF